MRLTSSICNFLKLPSRVLRLLVLPVAALALTMPSCMQHTDRTVTGPQATGKGNGGNKLQLSDKDVTTVLETLKPRLQIVFEGLRYLTLTEKSLPGQTDLQISPEMLKHLLLMFDGEAPALTDLATPDNLKPQHPPCVDFRGVKNAASAVIKDVGGPICLSIDKIESTALKNYDRAAEIFVLALATHEFVHHFVSTGQRDNDERAAQEIQEFVEQQLVRQVEVTDLNVISIDETKYLEQFREYAKGLYDSVLWQKEETR